MAVAVVVDWYGPYSLQEFKSEMRTWDRGTKALYFAVRSGNVVSYLGLTESPHTRFNCHPKIEHEMNLRFYCGEIVSQGLSGRRQRTKPTDLCIAEHALIAWHKPELNARLTHRDLDDCVVVYSRFFDRDDVESVVCPLIKFPSVIAYNSYSREWDM